ncbi:MAG: hypothetical protein WBD22_14630, partial [Pyrinomonadaceae bacterium]
MPDPRIFLTKAIFPGIALTLSIVFLSAHVHSQDPTQDPIPLKRTIFKSESHKFLPGNTFEIIGAPIGSIAIEGWSKNEVELSCVITIQAASESGLSMLEKVAGYETESRVDYFGVATSGINDGEHGDVPLPVRIDYTIKLPHQTGLRINGGRGDLRVSGVTGPLKITFLETTATIEVFHGP